MPLKLNTLYCIGSVADVLSKQTQSRKAFLPAEVKACDSKPFSSCLLHPHPPHPPTSQKKVYNMKLYLKRSKKNCTFFFSACVDATGAIRILILLKVHYILSI